MDHIRHAFGEDADLYQILKITRDDAEQPAKLRKAYFRQALVYHPDKQQQQQSSDAAAAAKEKFQAISFAYQVLKNNDKRAEYNETGHVDEHDDDDDDNKNKSQKDWKEYFDRIFGKVTTSKIDQFSVKYKCSEEEQRDVLKEYKRWKGDLVKMLEYVMLSEPLDAKRWVEDYIQPALQNSGSNDESGIPDYSDMVEKTLKKLEKKIEKEQKKAQAKNSKAATTKSTKASKKENKKPESDSDDDDDDDDEYDEEMSEEEDESATETEDEEEVIAEPVATKKKKNVSNAAKKVSATKAKPTKAKAKAPQPKKKKSSKDDDLIAMIQNNQSKRSAGSMFASLGARYGVAMDDDDDGDPLGDEEFDKISERLQTNKKKRAR